MNMRLISRTIVASALIAATTVAQASPRYPHEGHQSMARARVISSAPIYQTINEARTQCWTETVGYDRRHRHEGSGGAVIGAIAGGLLGSTVGKGNGRVAAAAVGAATGAVVGDRLDDRYADAPRQVERCETIDNPRRVISGYDVRYRYQGQDYSTRLPYQPGRHLNLRVSFEVAEDQRPGNWRDDDRDDR